MTSQLRLSLTRIGIYARRLSQRNSRRVAPTAGQIVAKEKPPDVRGGFARRDRL
jgi:hypothetical protein